MGRISPFDRNLARLLSTIGAVRKDHDEPLLDALYDRALEELERSRRSRSWYERDPGVYRQVERTVERMLRRDGTQKLLGRDASSGRLVASGLIKAGDGDDVAVTLIFPETYPVDPPATYVRRDGMLIPVETTASLQWTAGDDCEVVLEALRTALGQGGGPTAGRRE